MLGRLERPLPASWEEQQEQIVWTLTGKLT
jgi:hypothetical protein